MTLESSDIVVAPLKVVPDELNASIDAVYTPQRKSFYLTSMMRTLSASSMAVFKFGRGSLPHRMIEALAIELELLSFQMRDIIAQAVRTGTFEAFYNDGEYPDLPRFARAFPATFARGFVLLKVRSPLTAPEFIEQDDVFGTGDGRTVRAVTRVVFPAGASSVTVAVVAETPGSAGNLNAGSITQYLSGRGVYQVGNPAAIAGGRDGESRASVAERFQEFVQARTSTKRALLSCAFNSSVDGERAYDAALIAPWKVRNLNREMGYAQLFIDNGAGFASGALIAEIQLDVDKRAAFGQEISVHSASPLVISPTVELEVSRFANPAQLKLQAEALWSELAGKSLVEDGSGRGRMDAFDLKSAFDRLPGVITSTLLSHPGNVHPPLGAKIVPGALSVQIRRGDA